MVVRLRAERAVSLGRGERQAHMRVASLIGAATDAAVTGSGGIGIGLAAAPAARVQTGRGGAEPRTAVPSYLVTALQRFEMPQATPPPS